MNSKSFCLSVGHYVAAGFARFILYMVIIPLRSQWRHMSRYCDLVIFCHSREHYSV